MIFRISCEDDDDDRLRFRSARLGAPSQTVRGCRATPVSPPKLLVFSSIALRERQGPPRAGAQTLEDTPRMNAKTQPIRATNVARASRFVGRKIKGTVGAEAV